MSNDLHLTEGMTLVGHVREATINPELMVEIEAIRERSTEDVTLVCVHCNHPLIVRRTRVGPEARPEIGLEATYTDWSHYGPGIGVWCHKAPGRYAQAQVSPANKDALRLLSILDDLMKTER